MWSGPRNISTALMRSWGNRPDTFVCDEPFYAHYLVQTKIAHPGGDEVIRHQENDWRKVAAWLTGPIPEGKTIFYQKHMAHHLLPNMEPRLARSGDELFSHPRATRDADLAVALPAATDAGRHRTAATGRNLSASEGTHRPHAADHRCAAMCWTIHAVRSASYAMRCMCRSPRRCCRGRPDHEAPMASGRNTGTPPSRRPLRSNRTRPKTIPSPPRCEISSHNATNYTTNSIHTASGRMKKVTTNHTKHTNKRQNWR